ncbi:transglutaminase-like domain-containing protein, partial [Patescibacteria group bacterium]|nr:transglutaminase-like domain-containing protein [Patescibacteria group bacterium]
AKKAMERCFDKGQSGSASNIAVELAKQGDTESAKKAMERCFDEGWWYPAGLIAVELGDRESAKKAMEKCFDKGAWGSAGDIAVELGDTESAKKAMEKCFNEGRPGSAGDIAVELTKSLKEEKKGFALNLTEEQKLELLNLLQNPEEEKIRRYLEERYGKRTWQEELMASLSHSKRVAESINRAIVSSPELAMETMAAAPDLTADATGQKILFKMYPELRFKQEKRGGFFGYAGFSREESLSIEPTPESYLSPESFLSLEGGDPRMENAPEVIKMREFSPRFIPTGVFGRYSRTKNQWEKSYFTIPQDTGESDIRTFTLPSPPKGKTAVLPKTLGSAIVSERVFVLGGKGKKSKLEINENSLGETFAEIPKDAEEVVYSFKESKAQLPLADIRREELEKSYARLEEGARYGLTEKIAPLPADLKLFISSIRDRSPKEKLLLIEQFARQISYYDFDNREVQDLKRGKDMNETLAIMQERINELILKNPELAEGLKGKKYAGVCADFAKLTAMLLREAGFASGVMAGFAPHGKSVTLREAHALNFVLYPDASGQGLRPVLIDATPSGLTAEEEDMLSAIRLPSLEKRELENEEELIKLKDGLDAELDEILNILKSKDKAAIAKLSNGKLEQVVNLLLNYEVKEKHFKNVLRSLDAFWYTPYKDLDLSKEKEREGLREFLSKEIKRKEGGFEEEGERVAEKSAGGQFFTLLEDYTRRLKKGGKAKSDEEALMMMQDIFDTIEKDLDPVESRAATAVITYLRAKKKM